MTEEIQILKGVHPGIVLEKKLKEMKLAKGRFAISINEFPQTITAITKGKRRMNVYLAMKIENALGIDEGYFMILQVYHDIKQEKLKADNQIPDLSKLRPGIFWDTNINKIKWMTQRRAVIQRVFERGNETEQAEIIRFYGKDEVDKILEELRKRPPIKRI